LADLLDEVLDDLDKDTHHNASSTDSHEFWRELRALFEKYYSSSEADVMVENFRRSHLEYLASLQPEDKQLLRKQLQL
jgi:hypothetical protein